jgi:hypothetical protein
MHACGVLTHQQEAEKATVGALSTVSRHPLSRSTASIVQQRHHGAVLQAAKNRTINPTVCYGSASFKSSASNAKVKAQTLACTIAATVNPSKQTTHHMICKFCSLHNSL